MAAPKAKKAAAAPKLVAPAPAPAPAKGSGFGVVSGEVRGGKVLPADTLDPSTLDFLVSN